MLTPKVIIAPVDEPLTIDQCRDHLSIQPYEDSDATHPDDDMILAWLAAAREFCEQFCGLAFATRTLEVALDEFPDDDWLELPLGPVRDIISVIVGEGSDAETVDAEVYTLDNYRAPARIVLVGTWPIFTASTNAIRVRYLAGYGVDSDGGEAVPNLALAAMKLMLSHLYEHREATIEKAISELPLGVYSLLRPLRVRLGMA